MELSVGKMIGFIIIISLVYGGIQLKKVLEERALALAQTKPIPNATTCSQIYSIYNEANCCGSSGDVPCLREIPDCSSVSNGYVCAHVKFHEFLLDCT